MNRRIMLQWISRGLATVVAAVIGIPGVRFLIGASQMTTQAETRFQRLKRIQDLPLGRPVLVPVLGRKQDGWTKSDQEVLGRVWLVRQDQNPEGSPVQAFTSVCPHMGCQIQAHASNQGFVCPCHRARFGLDGGRQADSATGEQNHAPRGMDRLECRVMADAETGDQWVEVKFEKFVSGLEQQISRV